MRVRPASSPPPEYPPKKWAGDGYRGPMDRRLVVEVAFASGVVELAYYVGGEEPAWWVWVSPGWVEIDLDAVVSWSLRVPKRYTDEEIAKMEPQDRPFHPDGRNYRPYEAPSKPGPLWVRWKPGDKTKIGHWAAAGERAEVVRRMFA